MRGSQAARKSEPKPITPKGLAYEMIQAVESDPGCDVKAMLFRVDGKFVKFVGFESGSRCLVLDLTTKEYS